MRIRRNVVVSFVMLLLLAATPGWGEVPDTKAAETPPEVLPPGTLAPVTLKASLEKTKLLAITLNDVLKVALGENITLNLGETELDQKRVDYHYRLAELLPDVTAGYNQSRFVGVAQIFGGQTVGIYRTTYQPQLTANYTVYSAGQNIFELRASKHRLEAQKHMLEDTRQKVLAEVTLAYYDLQQAYWKRAIALQALKEAALQVDMNKARVEEGIGVKLEYLQAQTFHSDRKMELLQAENQISKASQRLAQLLNMDFDVDIVPSTIESVVIKRVPEEMTFTRMMALMYDHNPQLKALDRLQDAQKNDVRAAFTSVFPKLDVTAFINGTGPGINELGLTRFAGVSVTTNLLENLGMNNIIRTRQSKVVARQMDLSIKQAQRALEEGLANTMVDLKTLEQQIDVAKEELQFAQTAYQHALGRLKEGVGTNLDLQNAMTTLTNTRSNLANAFLNYNKSQVTLLSYLGVISFDTIMQGYLPHGNTAATP